MGDDGDEGDGARPPRPDLWTPQAKAVFAIWIGVTLVLVALYAIVAFAL